MTFALFKLFWLLFQPGNLLILVLGVGGLARLLAYRTLARSLINGAIVALIAVAVLPLGAWLQAPLENRFPILRELPPRVDGIVVLGGEQSIAVSEGRGQASFKGPEGKEIALAMLAKRYPSAKLLFSGGSSALDRRGPPEAEVERMVLADLGVDLGRVLFETRSRDTWENARFSYDLARPTPGETWLLVAAAQDMPRAIGCFRQVGWQVIAYPVNFRTTGEFNLLPGFDLTNNLAQLNVSLHEWLGLIAYYLMGRIPSLFPRP